MDVLYCSCTPILNISTYDTEGTVLNAYARMHLQQEVLLIGESVVSLLTCDRFIAICQYSMHAPGLGIQRPI